MAELEKKEWVDWLPTKTLQKAVVIDEAGNILVLKRADRDWDKRKGKWDLPGGSVNPEDVIEGNKKGGLKPTEIAIRREIEEETGLKIIKLSKIFENEWVFQRSIGNILGYAFGYIAHVNGITPIVTLNRKENEHTESEWLIKEEVLALDFGEDGGLHCSIVQKV